MSLVNRNPKVRGKSIETQLAEGLAELQAATRRGDEAARDSAKLRLRLLERIRVRKDKKARNRQNNKLDAAKLEILRLTDEVERLKRELAEALAKPAVRPLTEVEQALAKFAAEQKEGTNV